MLTVHLRAGPDARSGRIRVSRRSARSNDGWSLGIVVTMNGGDSAADLKHQQEAKERVEREDAVQSREDAEAAAHLRRAEKAEYLRGKLSEREAADASRDES